MSSSSAALLLTSLDGIDQAGITQVQIDLQALIRKRMVEVADETDVTMMKQDIQAIRLLNRLLNMLNEIPTETTYIEVPHAHSI